ncbi:MAG: folate family ECF transporter S component [Clostridia bacterium]|nr:folate family ECF transporter S component [Clostridia bacterium]
MYSKNRMKRLTLCAMLIALSVVIGIICKLYLTFYAIRITFENYGILFVGYIFGPVYGLAAGLLTDIITCIVTGQAFNPVICLGAGSVGLICGLMAKATGSLPEKIRICLSVMSGHAVGNMLIKSIGLYFFFSLPLESVIFRVPLYIIIGTCEILLIRMTLKNKEIKKRIEALK